MKLVIMNELRFFLNSILWGVILLVIYDVFRIIRRILKHNGFFIAVQDVIYWIVCSLLIFNMMYKQNNGIIRAFSILAILIGMLLYHGYVSDMVVNFLSMVFNKIISLIKLIITIVFDTILWPFKFLYIKIRSLVLFVFKNVRKLVLATMKSLKIKKKKVKIELTQEKPDD